MPANGPDAKTLLEIYRRAKVAVQNDARVRATIRSGRMATPYYPARGQEIIPAAISVQLTDRDYVVTTYRGMHDQLIKGVPLKEFWAEYAGRATGSCKGKGGPMHITHPASGVVVTTGIVGAGLPIGVGLALASQLRGEDRVAVVNFGDGASNIGAFHEALNMASLWKLPVLFVCQNNLFAEHTTFANGTAVEHVGLRAASYSMPGFTVNGNDPDEMWRTAKDAIDRARAGAGPTLIEARTFRFLGHVFGDDSSYIPKADLEAAIANDPVPKLRARLLDMGAASEAQLADIEAGIERDIDEAVAFAMDSPYADLSELRIDVFAEEIPA